MAPLRPNKREINVMRKAGGWAQSLPGYARLIKGWCNVALTDAPAGTVSVVLGDNAFVRELNFQYRGKDKATNVLSFASGAEGELGDIVLAYEMVQAEAAAQCKPFPHHTAHLIMHGCLHLLGHDHETTPERRAMEKLEIAYLAACDIANPYLTA